MQYIVYQLLGNAMQRKNAGIFAGSFHGTPSLAPARVLFACVFSDYQWTFLGLCLYISRIILASPAIFSD